MTNIYDMEELKLIDLYKIFKKLYKNVSIGVSDDWNKGRWKQLVLANIPSEDIFSSDYAEGTGEIYYNTDDDETFQEKTRNLESLEKYVYQGHMQIGEKDFEKGTIIIYQHSMCERGPNGSFTEYYLGSSTEVIKEKEERKKQREKEKKSGISNKNAKKEEVKNIPTHQKEVVEKKVDEICKDIINISNNKDKLTKNLKEFINFFLQKIDDIYKDKDKDWMKIITQGENEKVEFKSSLRWDYKTNNVNKDRETDIVKAISAFLNSKGGVLFIGIDDNSNIIGLDNDYKTLGKKQDKDGFQLKLVEIIKNRLGIEFSGYISTQIENFHNKEVAVIIIEKGHKACFLDEILYVRIGPSSQPLSPSKITGYINSHRKIKN